MTNNYLVNEYGSTKETMKTNVGTIRKLAEQLQSLKNATANIPTPENRKAIEGEISNIEKTIETLLDQTDRLFDQYQKFTERVFQRR